MTVCCRCKNQVCSLENWYGLHKNCFVEIFGLTELSQFTDLIPRSRSMNSLESYESKTSFFHGAFRKYSACLGKDNYILKVVQKDHPELPVMEYLCNRIYENLGIEVPNYYLIRYPEESLCFVTRNFISSFSNASLEHIYHYLENKYDHNCEKLVKIIGEKTGRRAEQERFVFLTLADSLIGNHDRHGRNIGFIRTTKGMQLAPFYDNPSYIGLDDDSMLGADLQPRGAIFTKESDKPTMKDYVYEWKRLGYENVVQDFRLKFSLIELRDILQSSFLGEKRQNAMLRLINKRWKELCEN